MVTRFFQRTKRGQAPMGGNQCGMVAIKGGTVLGTLCLIPMSANAATYSALVSIVSPTTNTQDSRQSPSPLFLSQSNSQGYTIAQSTPLAGGTVYAETDGGNGFAYQARAELVYDIRFVGPALGFGQTIPVLVEAMGYASTRGPFGGLNNAGASFNFSNVTFMPVNTNISAGANADGSRGIPVSQSFNVSQLAMIIPNTDYRVSLLASTQAGFAYGSATGFHSEAYADPRFTIQSGYETQYSIQGLLAPAAVPEPSAWAMMIAGFGLAGTAVRRRGQSLHKPRRA